MWEGLGSCVRVDGEDGGASLVAKTWTALRTRYQVLCGVWSHVLPLCQEGSARHSRFERCLTALSLPRRVCCCTVLGLCQQYTMYLDATS